MADRALRVLVVGCGNMGAAHAQAYAALEAFTLCGLVARGASKERLQARLGENIPLFEEMHDAIKQTSPDAVCIATWPDSHEVLALTALAAGCHVFLEKPLATTLSGAKRVVATARLAGKQLVVGYILRHHPAWRQFIELAQNLGKPLVMRMNLNQQSSGGAWHTHKMLMQSLSPIVDCGVHYLDVMCQMTQGQPAFRQRHRRAPERRDSAAAVQLRPAAGAFRRRFRRLVRSRLGADDEPDGVLY
ncbi:Gfo/Idh/MocA family protein [Dryocola sp. BD586]|uniref:Gfo/Idh/MocA family protein n=1 Tax=Dryocola sp. BD586 TaxID=3133271 RepID=UPI003F508301